MHRTPAPPAAVRSQESIGVQFAIDAAFLFLALGVGKLSLKLFFALRGRLHALHLLAVRAGFGQSLAYYVDEFHGVIPFRVGGLIGGIRGGRGVRRCNATERKGAVSSVSHTPIEIPKDGKTRKCP